MEPQIIQYYNELPYYAIVINDLNQEYDNLLSITQGHFIEMNSFKSEYNDLKKELEMLKKKENIQILKIIFFYILIIIILGMTFIGIIFC